jgi:hypothetical protein
MAPTSPRASGVTVTSGSSDPGSGATCGAGPPPAAVVIVIRAASRTARLDDRPKELLVRPVAPRSASTVTVAGVDEGMTGSSLLKQSGSGR